MRRILINIDGSSNDRDSLRTAAAYCDMTGAALTVAHPHPGSTRVHGFGETTTVLADGNTSARAAFDEICGGRQDARFVAYEAEADAIVAWLGPGHDLILIERLSSEEGPEAETLNAALFETGRPVVLLPPQPDSHAIQRPALAWNGTAMASRAIRAALPLMQSAGQAVILIGSAASHLRPAPLLEYLDSYGIKGEVQPYDSDRLTARARGRALIAAAQDVQADLLVTGAFGEAAGGSILGLGRATRKVATAAPIPVLMQN